jgi:hypothetical protein
LHSPSEHGLDYEDATFPAHDGVPLEGWFIPAPGSTKLIIANHPLGLSRSGIPTHLQPWHGDWAASGNGFKVDLVPDYKILHDTGYNVLAYDLRNHGLSSAANGGVTTHGFTETRATFRRCTTTFQRPTRSSSGSRARGRSSGLTNFSRRGWSETRNVLSVGRLDSNERPSGPETTAEA